MNRRVPGRSAARLLSICCFVVAPLMLGDVTAAHADDCSRSKTRGNWYVYAGLRDPGDEPNSDFDVELSGRPRSEIDRLMVAGIASRNDTHAIVDKSLEYNPVYAPHEFFISVRRFSGSGKRLAFAIPRLKSRTSSKNINVDLAAGEASLVLHIDGENAATIKNIEGYDPDMDLPDWLYGKLLKGDRVETHLVLDGKTLLTASTDFSDFVLAAADMQIAFAAQSELMANSERCRRPLRQ